ncbi:MAG: RloB family protein [Candidatus Methanoplasma sp.]|jgi:hypothetical protein|nr:RloB family protein [Candidatus Methanoplasma sp.]
MRPTSDLDIGRERGSRDPKKRCVIVCEGVRTEIGYFDKLREAGTDLGMAPLVDVVALNRLRAQRGHSNPCAVAELAENISRW